MVDAEREPFPRLTVGVTGEGPDAEVDDMLAGGIAVEDLEEEQVDGRDGAEEPFAPGIVLLTAGGFDGFGGQTLGRGLLQPVENGDDARWHGRTPCGT